MDKAQLITIIVSALAGAMAKPLVDWLISLVKSTELMKTLAAISRKAFSKNNRAVIFDLFTLSFYVIVLVNFAIDKAAPTKLDILIAIGSSLACLITAASLFISISKAINANKTP